MKANHKCKYSKCTLGAGGGRKEYYACPHCDASQSWRSVACCKEHYNLYIEEVLAERAQGHEVSLLPDRTDMEAGDIKALVNMPLDKALEATKKELKDYADDIAEIGVSATIEKINNEIDEDPYLKEPFENQAALVYNLLRKVNRTRSSDMPSVKF